MFGTASGVTVFAGSQVVESGGLASNTTVANGGTLDVKSGGVADPTVILSGGTENVSAGGTAPARRFPAARSSSSAARPARRCSPARR